MSKWATCILSFALLGCAPASSARVGPATGLPLEVRRALDAGVPGWTRPRVGAARPGGREWRTDWMATDWDADHVPDYFVQLVRPTRPADLAWVWVHRSAPGAPLQVALLWTAPLGEAQWFRPRFPDGAGLAGGVEWADGSLCALLQTEVGLGCARTGPS